MRRRDLLKTAVLIGGAPLLGAVPDTGGAGNRRLRRFEDRLAALRAKTGLTIKRIETFTQGSVLSFVRITCDDGSEGYGCRSSGRGPGGDRHRARHPGQGG